jgi:hypothetical protein
MKKTVVTRDYNFSDALLKQKADEMMALLDRDQIEFAERGYNDVAKAVFANAIQIVDDHPADETLAASKMIFTSNKNAIRSIVEKSMRTIFNMAANTFGTKSAQYRAFGKANISKQSDTNLVRTCRVMVIAAAEHLEALSAEGLTQEKINKLIEQGIALEDSLVAVSKGVSDRDIVAESRIKSLNASYALVMRYASIGQDIFYEENEAKYNDYVIYNTSSGLPIEEADAALEA